MTPRTEDVNTGWISKAASKVIENLINLDISTSYFFLSNTYSSFTQFKDWKYTGKLDKIFSRDFEIWILILLKIYITQKKQDGRIQDGRIQDG